MHLRLERQISDDAATLGRLYVDGAFRCWTLEDTYRAKKIDAETRIPAGVYEIGLSHASKFEEYKRDYFPRREDMNQGLLELKNVPNYRGILIHMGNYDLDTEGCILVGKDGVDPKGRPLRTGPDDAARVRNRDIKKGRRPRSLRQGRYCVMKSGAAYEDLYLTVIAELRAGRGVTIEIVDDDAANRASTGASRPGIAAATTAAAGGVVAAGAQLDRQEEGAVVAASAQPPADPWRPPTIAEAAASPPAATTASEASPPVPPWLKGVVWKDVIFALGVLIVLFALYLFIHRLFDWRRERRPLRASPLYRPDPGSKLPRRWLRGDL